MNVFKLLFSPSGTANRAQFILGVFIVAVIAVLGAYSWQYLAMHTVANYFLGAVFLLTQWCLFCLFLKRLRDLHWGLWWVAVPFIGGFLVAWAKHLTATGPIAYPSYVLMQKFGYVMIGVFYIYMFMWPAKR